MVCLEKKDTDLGATVPASCAESRTWQSPSQPPLVWKTPSSFPIPGTTARTWLFLSPQPVTHKTPATHPDIFR